MLPSEAEWPASQLLSHIGVGKGVGLAYTCTHVLRELEVSGVAVACLSNSFHLHSCRPTHSPLGTPEFAQISDHGEVSPGYREGTDYALEAG